jgi:hypothetical protein
MSEEYRIALAYSNIQREYSISPFISGVIAHEDDFLELEKRDLPKKQTLMHRKDSLSWLQNTFDDVSQYLTYHLVVPLKYGWSVKDLEDQYTKILNILRYVHLRVIVGRIKSITIRVFGSYDKVSKRWHAVPFHDDFLNHLYDFSANCRIIEKGTDRLLEIAKILSRLEYERKRFFGEDYVTSRIRREPLAYLQIVKIRWDSPPIHEYDDGIVGLPALIIRKLDPPSIQHIYLTKGMHLSFTPLAKFCRGSQSGQIAVPCQYSDDINPFGLPLIGSSSEQCNKCQKLSEYSICLYRKPLCNGYEVKCGNKVFAGNICCGLFALYVIRLGNDLKVGTAILSNVLGRLLEQGAGYALVFYPLESIMAAHALEKVVKERLADSMQSLNGFGVENVYRRAPPKQEVLNDFLQNWHRSDEKLLEMARSEISMVHTQIDGLDMDLSQTEHKICKLQDNYIKPVTMNFIDLKSTPFFQSIEGSIAGYRGSYLFLDSEEIVDLDRLQGFVVKGSL